MAEHYLLKECLEANSPFSLDKIKPFKNIEEIFEALDNEEVQTSFRISNGFGPFFHIKSRMIEGLTKDYLEQRIQRIREFGSDYKNPKEKLQLLTGILLDIYGKDLSKSKLQDIFKDGDMGNSYAAKRAVLLYIGKSEIKAEYRQFFPSDK